MMFTIIDSFVITKQFIPKILTQCHLKILPMHICAFTVDDIGISQLSVYKWEISDDAHLLGSFNSNNQKQISKPLMDIQKANVTTYKLGYVLFKIYYVISLMLMVRL